MKVVSRLSNRLSKSVLDSQYVQSNTHPYVIGVLTDEFLENISGQQPHIPWLKEISPLRHNISQASPRRAPPRGTLKGNQQ